MSENPFPGLRPFEAEEGHLFFGREQATDELLKKLRENRFIAVVGTSGSGKSSLVRAGLLPDLYGGFMAGAGSHWRVAVLRPGDTPIRALAEALTAPGVLSEDREDLDMQREITEAVLHRGAFGLIEVARQARLARGDNLLVLVDQFEELFRIRSSSGKNDTEEGAAFVKLLLEASKQRQLPIYVMLTMRSEYLGDCTRFRNLPEAINAGQYLIPRMTRDQARQAITGPIAVAGAQISSPLVQRLLNDVGDNPDQLPIMQHAMMRTWGFWKQGHTEGEEVGLSHYQATGGMEAALSRHADEAFDELPDSRSKLVAERIFKRLTGLGSGDREMRYPTSVAELCEVCGATQQRIATTIEAFRRHDRSFLMPPPGMPLTDETVIDISHESLIRIWKRLREWVEEEGLSARHYTRLAEASELYARKETSLWRDPELGLALQWRDENEPNEAWSWRYHNRFAEAMAFLDASKSAALRRRMMLLVPAVLLPLAVGVYVTKTAISMVQEQMEEYRLALVQAQEQGEREQELVAKVTEKANKIIELKGDVAVIEGMEAQLERKIEKELGELQQVQIRGGSQVERDKILETLDDLSAQTKALQDVARQRKERIEETIAEPADESISLAAMDDRAGPESAPTAAPHSESTFASSVGTKTEVASLEDLDSDTSREKPGDVVNPSMRAPSVAASMARENTNEASFTAALPETDSERPSAWVDAPSVDTKTTLADEPEVCAAARGAAGYLPNRALLEKWVACADALDEGEAKTVARAEVEQLRSNLRSYASIAADKNFLTCTAVSGLSCEGATDQFSPGRVYVYARIAAPAEASLALDWFRQDDNESPFWSGTLAVKQNTGRGFRTFTWKSVTKPGDYVVKLYNEQRQLIAQRDFTVR